MYGRFNPPHLIPVVEVVPSKQTAEAAVETCIGLLRRAGKTPIRLKKEVGSSPAVNRQDTTFAPHERRRTPPFRIWQGPGFVVNRIQLAMLREAWAPHLTSFLIWQVPGFVVNRIQLAMLREAWALLDGDVVSAEDRTSTAPPHLTTFLIWQVSAEDLDAAVKGTLGLRLAAVGPLRVADFAGLDIWCLTLTPTLTRTLTEPNEPDEPNEPNEPNPGAAASPPHVTTFLIWQEPHLRRPRARARRRPHAAPRPHVARRGWTSWRQIGPRILRVRCHMHAAFLIWQVAGPRSRAEEAEAEAAAYTECRPFP